MAFLSLAILQYCVFGSLIRQIGVYLDEWIFFSNLHLCQNTWFDYFKYLINDSRVIIRPAFAPFFATLYYFFHENPLGYHLLNQACELAGAFFLYLALIRIFKDKVLSLFIAALFLIYPSHDLTHYSISATSTVIAVMFFNLSLWQFAIGVEDQEEKHSERLYANKFIWFSAFSFLLSLLNYEICLPLFIVFTAVATILLWKKYSSAKVFSLAIFYSIPSLLAILLTILYRTLLLPFLGLGWGYRTVFDPLNFIHVIYEGIKISILPYAFSFFFGLARDYLREGINFFHLAYIVIAIAVLFGASWLLTKNKTELVDRSKASKLAMALGLLILSNAYLIFALSPDYLPVLDSGINRVNTASSIGAAMIVAGFIGWLTSFIKSTSSQNRTIILAGLLLPFVLLFILADWQFAGPWIVSWRAQKEVINIIKKRAAQIHTGDTIILANLPRYTMWAPVFDGVWDFQSALRVTLNRSDIAGGVLSDRLVITPTFLEDRFKTTLCARYLLKQIIILIPNPERWIPVYSAQEFIDLAKKYNVIVTRENMDKLVGTNSLH